MHTNTIKVPEILKRTCSLHQLSDWRRACINIQHLKEMVTSICGLHITWEGAQASQMPVSTMFIYVAHMCSCVSNRNYVWVISAVPSCHELYTACGWEWVSWMLTNKIFAYVAHMWTQMCTHVHVPVCAGMCVLDASEQDIPIWSSYICSFACT